jgi:hypothetical protein
MIVVGGSVGGPGDPALEVITTDATDAEIIVDHVAAALERRCQQFKLASEDGDGLGNGIEIPGGTFDLGDEWNGLVTVTVAAGSYSIADLVAAIQAQTPDPAVWIVAASALNVMSFAYALSILQVQWTTEALRDALGFTSDAVDWDTATNGPFTATRPLSLNVIL